MNNQSLETIINAEGIIVNSDIHGDYNRVFNTLKTANDENLFVLYNGDIVNDYNFKEIAHQLGIYTPNEIFYDYLSKKLSQRDLETFQIYSNLQNYSLEDMLSQVPNEHREEAKKTLEEVINYSNTEIFQKRIQKVISDFEKEKKEEVKKSQLKLRALYDIIMDEEARKFAHELNKFKNRKVGFLNGNHENAYFVELVKQYLENKEQIIDLTKHRGYITIKDSNDNKTTIAGMTNCSQYMPYLSEIFSQDELSILYSHMNIDQVKEKSLLIGEISKEELEKYRELIQQDPDYRRIKEGNLEKKLDIFVSHGQIGKPMSHSNYQLYDVPYFASAAILSNEADLTIEGHIHNQYEGPNSFGKKLIRAAGENAVIIRKDKDGKLKTKWVKITNRKNYTPSYDLKYLNIRIEDMLKQYELLLSKTHQNDEILEESKAA